MVRQGFLAASLTTLVALSIDIMAAVAQESWMDETTSKNCVNLDISGGLRQSNPIWPIVDDEGDQCITNCTLDGSQSITHEDGEYIVDRKKEAVENRKACIKIKKKTKKKRIKIKSCRANRRKPHRALISPDGMSSPTRSPSYKTPGDEREFDDWLGRPAQDFVDYLEENYGACKVKIAIIRPVDRCCTKDYKSNRIRIFVNGNALIIRIRPWG